MNRKGGGCFAERGREKSAVSRLFPRESGCEFVGTPTRGRTGERSRTFHEHHSISGQGSATGWERRRARRIDASFCLNYRHRSYDFLRPPAAPSSRFFSSFSTFRASSGHHSPIMSSVSSVYAHNFKDGGCWTILRNTLCKGMPWLRFKCRL